MVLDKLNKTEKKLRVLDGPPGISSIAINALRSVNNAWLYLKPHPLHHAPSGSKLKNREECSGLQVDCLMTLGQWDRAAVMLSEMIRASPDQWSYIRQYINCQIKRCRAKRREGVVAREECGGGEEEEGMGKGEGSKGEEGNGSEAGPSADGSQNEADVSASPSEDASKREVNSEEKWTWNELRYIRFTVNLPGK